jgi:hypothetical protein
MVVCFIRQAASALKITNALVRPLGPGQIVSMTTPRNKLPQFAKERAYGNPALAKPSAMR